MRARAGAVLLLLLSSIANADVPRCGTSEWNDARVHAIHERPGRVSRIAANADTPAVTKLDGMFFVANDEGVSFGTRHFDLAGQSLVFEPREGKRFAVQRQPLRYVEPEGEALHDFETREGSPWHYVTWDLTRFELPLFGQSVKRVYLSAFNGIHLAPPAESRGMQFDALEAAVYRDVVLSPLMITSAKPRTLAYPKLYVIESDTALTITWRSQEGISFGYDVQAELRSDGSIIYSYRSPREMAWGTPILSPGFDPNAVASRSLVFGTDPLNDTASDVRAAVARMLDIRSTEVIRVDESDLFKVRVRVDAPIDRSTLVEGEMLLYYIDVGSSHARLEVTPSGWRLLPFDQSAWVPSSAAADIAGDVIEVYGVQPKTAATMPVTVRSFGAGFGHMDTASIEVPFDLPLTRIASDFSSVTDGTELETPVAEPFTLGVLDVLEVWNRIQPHTSLSASNVDAVAVYQSFYSDLIFYAGAYAFGGNPQVGGIRPVNSFQGPEHPRAPTLLHMNQYRYAYNSRTESASQVLLHEFGHRWLYFFNIMEGNQLTHSLNPTLAHPAAYVHTPAAFPVYSEREASVMGGAYFTPLQNGMYEARAKNAGFSWTDLYLMGLASPAEVEPWFYLANTTPPLPTAYWPQDGAIVNGQLRPVNVNQIIDAHGPRQPDASLSQKRFRVLFVLVTEHGGPPSEEDAAQMNEWRAILERDFHLATGGRGRVDTSGVVFPRRRAVR